MFRNDPNETQTTSICSIAEYLSIYLLPTVRFTVKPQNAKLCLVRGIYTRENPFDR